MKQYYLENKEKIIQRTKQYHLENRIRICQYKKQDRQNHPDKVRKWGQVRYLKHGEKMLAKSKGRYAQASKALYDQFFQIYGDKCACCGESNRQFLTLDHINNNGVAERKAINWFGCMRKAIRESDKTQYQVLCYNCNYGKRRNKGICPHKS